MESHPEKDHHSKHQTQCHDALLGLLLRQLRLRAGISLHSILLLAALGMTEGITEDVINGDGKNQRSTGHGKREVIGVVAGIAQCCLGILLDPDGSRRSKECTDVDGHIEDGEASIALVLILRVIIQVTHHHLEVTLEESSSKADEQESCQHDDQCKTIASQGHRQQQITCKHDDDTCGHHLAKAELVGHNTTDQREEIHQHQERTIDRAGHSRRQSVVGSQKQCENREHRVIAETLARVGQCQRK